MNVIPDTVIWSMILRRSQPNTALQKLFSDLIEEGRVLLPGIIKKELLSGIINEVQFENLASKLHYFTSIHATDEDHILAAKYFNKCLKFGVQGGHIDFLIVAMAVNNSAMILTKDKDFEYYRRHIDFELMLV